MATCPIWRWYMYPPGSGKPDYAINSAIIGSIELIPNSDRAKIATDALKSDGKHLECAISDEAREVLNKEAEGQNGKVRHYGLIIVRPGKEKELSKSEVRDFISFHRDPKVPTEKPTIERYDLSKYNEVFEDLVRKQPSPSTAQ
jgi:hypothetical protein